MLGSPEYPGTRPARLHSPLQVIPPVHFSFLSQNERGRNRDAGGRLRDENNNLVSYRANLVIRSSSESESSIELQEDGFNKSSLRPVVKHQLPLGHSSDVEGNFTSTEESSEDNLNLLGQTEVTLSQTHSHSPPPQLT